MQAFTAYIDISVGNKLAACTLLSNNMRLCAMRVLFFEAFGAILFGSFKTTFNTLAPEEKVPCFNCYFDVVASSLCEVADVALSEKVRCSFESGVLFSIKKQQ